MRYFHVIGVSKMSRLRPQTLLVEEIDSKSFLNGLCYHKIGVKLTTGYKCSILSSKMRIYAVWQYL